MVNITISKLQSWTIAGLLIDIHSYLNIYVQCTPTNLYTHIKTHGSELRGQEEAAYATYHEHIYTYVRSTALKFVIAVTKPH